jgi:RimJ/RimL family protein N-acetyltransferase
MTAAALPDFQVALTGVPVLETQRLILRAPHLADFEGFVAYQASARSAFTGGPLHRNLAWRSFGHIVGHWVLRGYGVFVIEDRATGRALGTSGPFFPEGWPEPEIAWTLWHPDAEGRGIAQEAARAARDFAYDRLGWTTAASLIDPDNHRSAALARRLGCVAEGLFHHAQHGPLTVWRHPAPAQAAPYPSAAHLVAPTPADAAARRPA